MSRFREELSVIPKTAKVIACIVYVIAAIAINLGIRYSGDRETACLPPAGKLALTLFAPIFVVALVLLIGYVYGDAKRRGMRYVLWTLLAALVPDAIGIILYFILRDPKPARCPACGGMVLAKFVFCPHCGVSMQPTCPQCGKPVDTTWANCPYCGDKLPRQTGHAA
jgi:DNA-directed RNA polymerase subunit RPC12/RpoP